MRIAKRKSLAATPRLVKSKDKKESSSSSGEESEEELLKRASSAAAGKRVKKRTGSDGDDDGGTECTPRKDLKEKKKHIPNESEEEEESDSENEEEEARASELRALRVIDLRPMLKRLNQPSSGRKEELVQRILQYEREERKQEKQEEEEEEEETEDEKVDEENKEEEGPEQEKREEEEAEKNAEEEIKVKEEEEGNRQTKQECKTIIRPEHETKRAECEKDEEHDDQKHFSSGCSDDGLMESERKSGFDVPEFPVALEEEAIEGNRIEVDEQGLSSQVCETMPEADTQDEQPSLSAFDGQPPPRLPRFSKYVEADMDQFTRHHKRSPFGSGSRHFGVLLLAIAIGLCALYLRTSVLAALADEKTYVYSFYGAMTLGCAWILWKIWRKVEQLLARRKIEKQIQRALQDLKQYKKKLKKYIVKIDEERNLVKMQIEEAVSLTAPLSASFPTSAPAVRRLSNKLAKLNSLRQSNAARLKDMTHQVCYKVVCECRESHA